MNLVLTLFVVLLVAAMLNTMARINDYKDDGTQDWCDRMQGGQDEQ